MIKPNGWEETEACVQANFDDLDNGKIKDWQARNNILAHFKTKLTQAILSAEERGREEGIKECMKITADNALKSISRNE